MQELSKKKKASFYLLLAIIIVLVAETLGLLVISLRSGELVLPWNLYRNVNQRYWKKISSHCGFDTVIVPHPYLGYVYGHQKKCHLGPNALGFQSKDYPKRRDPLFYDILVLGGSTAELLASIKTESGQYFFEEYLNRNFISPTQKPFRVFSAATGGYKHPNQLIAYLMFGEFADAIFSIEGFNEHFVYKEGYKLERPDAAYYQLSPVFEEPNLTELAVKVVKQRIQVTISNVFPLKYSSTLFLMQQLFYSEDTLTEKLNHKMKIENGFRFEQSISKEEGLEYNLNRHLEYLQQINRLAKKRKTEFIAFIQPVPVLYKRLTSIEKQQLTIKGYEDIYQQMTEALVSSATENELEIVSLLKILEQHPERYYIDHIHFNFHYPLPEGVQDGQLLLAKNLAKSFLSKWGFQRRSSK